MNFLNSMARNLLGFVIDIDDTDVINKFSGFLNIFYFKWEKKIYNEIIIFHIYLTTNYYYYYYYFLNKM